VNILPLAVKVGGAAMRCRHSVISKIRQLCHTVTPFGRQLPTTGAITSQLAAPTLQSSHPASASIVAAEYPALYQFHDGRLVAQIQHTSTPPTLCLAAAT